MKKMTLLLILGVSVTLLSGCGTKKPQAGFLSLNTAVKTAKTSSEVKLPEIKHTAYTGTVSSGSAVIAKILPALMTKEKKNISLSGSAFFPQRMYIRAGSTILRKNNDTSSHTITFDNGMFDSTLAKNTSAGRTFPQAGTYNYHSKLDPSMTGTIIVK